MTKLPFRVLYRQFLFRLVDLELLSADAQGDISKLLGRFAAMLIFVGVWLSLSPVGMEHMLIATTMLVVGLFTVLSWDSTFPDRRDILILAPLPLSARTLFFAKIAASASALSVTVVAFNALTGLTLPVALTPPGSSLLDLILSPALYRSFAAYWITMMSAGLFIFCSVLAVQGLAAQLMPRRYFVRLSSFLQMAAFGLFLGAYLFALENSRIPTWLPSYWFLGLFQELNGSRDPAMFLLARRASIGVTVVMLGAAAAFLLSYFRTLRQIVEEPDIIPGSRRAIWLPPFGNSLETAVVQFSIRTLLRSRQHRVILAFYLGIGFAVSTDLVKRAAHAWHVVNEPLMVSTFVMMCASVIGTRVLFSMPVALRANWIFRVTEVRGIGEYLAAIRRPLFVLGVTPVWLVSAAIFLWIWPWRPAAEHLVVLGAWGFILAYLSLRDFQKIPFTCSYLPGKSYLHMAVLASVWLLLLLLKGAEFERRALTDPARYGGMVAFLAIVAVLARWLALAHANSEEAIVQFEEVQPPAVLTLGLN